VVLRRCAQAQSPVPALVAQMHSSTKSGPSSGGAGVRAGGDRGRRLGRPAESHSSLGLPVPPKDLQHRDPKVVLQAVMGSWLPLAPAVLSMVVDHLPNPIQGQRDRIGRFLPTLHVTRSWRRALEAEGHEGPGSSSHEGQGPSSGAAQGELREGDAEHANGGSEALASPATNGVADTTSGPSKQSGGGTEGVEGPDLRALQRVVRALRAVRTPPTPPMLSCSSPKWSQSPRPASQGRPRPCYKPRPRLRPRHRGSPWGTPGEEGALGEEQGQGQGRGRSLGARTASWPLRIFSGRLRPGQRLCVLSSSLRSPEPGHLPAPQAGGWLRRVWHFVMSATCSSRMSSCLSSVGGLQSACMV